MRFLIWFTFCFILVLAKRKAHFDFAAKKRVNLDFAFGSLAKEEGLSGQHPVIFIPGIISSGLEVWNPTGCGKKYFRKKFWASTTKIKAALFDRTCWYQHMRLDEKTGMDNGKYKLRASTGFTASDYFLPRIGIWAKLISNMAALGYDSNSMYLMAYDWRLSPTKLQQRDLFFTKLKSTIEIAYQSHTGHTSQVLIISHSMGSLHFFYFLQWLQNEMGVEEAGRWVDQFLYSWMNVGGPLLGATKPLTYLISGESEYSIKLSGLGGWTGELVEKWFPRKEWLKLLRSWGGLAGLLPKGGDAIWGNSTFAPDELQGHDHLGGLIEYKSVRSSPSSPLSSSSTRITASSLDEFLKNDTVFGSPYYDHWKNDFAVHSTQQAQHIQANRHNPRYWSNPLLSPLPSVGRNSTFKIVCLYGVGLPTQRKYYYTDYVHGARRFGVDTTRNGPHVNRGVVTSDGDGTVPLISLGYMCSKGWKSALLNPSQIPIITREYQTEPEPLLPGDSVACEHSGILGHGPFLKDILNATTGALPSHRIYSKIETIVNRVDL